MPISNELRFHLHWIDALDASWEKLETIFGKHNEILGHQLGNELVTLNPRVFSCIQYYLLSTKPPDS